MLVSELPGDLEPKIAALEPVFRIKLGQPFCLEDQCAGFGGNRVLVPQHLVHTVTIAKSSGLVTSLLGPFKITAPPLSA